MLRVEQVNFDEPAVAQNRIPFENLTPLYPERAASTLKRLPTEISTRIINLFCPIGKGQRALIVSPPQDRQDDPAAEDSQRHHGQPSRGLPHRPADRRAA